MHPYSPGKPIDEVKRELGLSEVVKLASNENPLGPSPKAIAAVKAAAEEMHLYPDGAAYDLKQAISAKFGVPHNRVVVGNGSDEIIHMLGLVMLSGPEDEVIVGEPSFVRYDAAAHLAPSKLIKVPLDSDYRHDLSAMAARVTPNTKMVFVANPNNPTGTVVGRREVDAFLRDVPSDVLLILDEAYLEFAEHLEDYPASTLYLDRPNVVGLRTFSKTHGLAGIRVGYGFVPEWLSDAIDRAREPFDVNALAQAAGIAALSDTEHVRRTLENNTRGMKRLNEFLVAHGARPVESYANFVLADFGRPARPLFDQLLRQGVIVRPGDVLGCPNCLRISIGTDEEMSKLLSALEQSMGVESLSH